MVEGTSAEESRVAYKRQGRKGQGLPPRDMYDGHLTSYLVLRASCGSAGKLFLRGVLLVF